MADGSSSTPYPKRPKFFSHRFTRLLAKVCLANEIGAEACYLLVIVAHTEDAAGYRKPVTFFNHQLAPLIGAGSEDSLDRIRRRAVNAGWLHYEPGRKHVPGRYFVTVPPAAADIDDLPSDESGDDLTTADMRVQPREKPGESAGTTAENVRVQPRHNRGECADHSSLSLSLSLSQDTPIPPQAGVNGAVKRRRKRPAEVAAEGFDAFWTAWPRKEAKDAAIRAWNKIQPDASLRDRILAAVNARRRTHDWMKENGRFIPHPATWLNGRRWEDEIAGSRPQRQETPVNAATRRQLEEMDSKRADPETIAEILHKRFPKLASVEPEPPES